MGGTIKVKKLLGWLKNWNKKRTILLIVFVVIVAIVLKACVGKGNTSSFEGYSLMPVEKQNLSDEISLKGTVSGESSTHVASVASAKVLEVNVQVGDQVTAGETLVRLDDSDIKSDIAMLSTEVANTAALNENAANEKVKSLNETIEDQSVAMQKAKKAYDEADNNVKKAQEKLNFATYDLYQNWSGDPNDTNFRAALDAKIAAEDGVKSANSALQDAFQNYLDTGKAESRKLESAQNAVDMQKYQSDSTLEMKKSLKKLNNQLNECVLVAPCSGVVTAVDVAVGDSYSEGSTMVIIENTDSMKIVVGVNEKDILKLEEGMKASVTTDATGDKVYEGEITRVVRVKNQSTKKEDSADNSNSTYSAEITLKDADLLIGMTAKARITLTERGDVLAIPYDLVRYDDDGTAYVLVADMKGENKAKTVRKNVELGQEVNYYVEVVGGELAEGDMLVCDYMAELEDGQEISIFDQYLDDSSYEEEF